MCEFPRHNTDLSVSLEKFRDTSLYSEVPDDLKNKLVALSGDNPADFTDDTLRAIDEAGSYDSDSGVILIEYSDTHGIETNPTDCGINVSLANLTLIDHGLHRRSEEDGFYHA